MLHRVAAVLVTVALCLASACAATAPMPTLAPEPTTTQIEVLATKPEHLEGIWLDGTAQQYQRWDTDGTIRIARNTEDLGKESSVVGTYWFEEGMYYEDAMWCDGIGVYRVYLRIEAGRADRLYTRLVDDPCLDRRISYARPVSRVD